MNIEFGCHPRNAKAKFLLPVLEGWHKAINHYAAMWNGKDAPYCNNERANVGLLAGGAWLAGWAVLEEYPNPKKRRRKSKLRSSGRVDLYIRRGKREAIFEAKHHALSAATQNLDSKISKFVDDAVDCAREETYTKDKFGCVFFVPHFRPEKFREFETAAGGLIKKHIERYRQSTDADLWAWCFPKCTRNYIPPNGKSYYPGVILAIKKV